MIAIKSWQSVNLGSVVQLINGDRGKNYPSQKDFINDGIPFINAGHLKEGSVEFGSMNYISQEKFNVLGSGKVQSDDILYCLRGSLGKTAIIQDIDKGAIASSLVIIRPSKNITTKYLFYFLTSDLGQAEIYKYDNGSTQPNLSAASVKAYQIPLPPLEEQKRIAAILDKADRVRRKRQEAIRLTEELGRSIFLDMFGDPVTNPKGWEVVSMKSIVKQTQYGTSEKSNTDRKGIPVLRMNNLTYKGNLDLHDIKWCEISEKDYEKYTIKKGDLLFNRTNSPELVGKTAVWNICDEYAFAGYLVRVRFNESKANSEYVSAYLNSSHGKKYLSSKAKASINMSNFSASEFVKIPILLPPIDLQNQFKLIKEEIASKKSKVEEFHFESENLFNSLLQRAFRGEL